MYRAGCGYIISVLARLALHASFTLALVLSPACWSQDGQTCSALMGFPRRILSAALCAYPKHAQYNGTGDPEDAKNFVCRE